ncbi:MAG TPA: TolC family protein [Vicinamibacterales bacterium]|nr:TolC family protein [Vicinamibacterales bacterium]HPW20688.1 TolC family protein [Vicinamibacterales bacterium]
MNDHARRPTAAAFLIAALAAALGAAGPGAAASTGVPPPPVPPPAAPAPATPPAPSGAVTLSLDDAIARALQASHRIGEALARQEAADAAVAARKAANMPTISLAAGYLRTNHVDEFGIPAMGAAPARIIYPDVPDNWRSRLDVQWPIYTFGRVEAAERAARAEAAASGRDTAATRADVRLDAARAFWAYATAIESVRVVEEALALVDAHLRDVRNMRAVGLLAPNDVLSAEARRSRQEVQLIEARTIRDVAEADLRRVTGIPPDVSIAVDAALEAAPAPIPSGEALLAEAQAKRPERQALESRAAAVGERQAAAAAGRRPSVALTAGVDYARPNARIFPRAAAWNDSWDLGVSVAWPLWDGGRAKAEIAEAAASRRALAERLAEFDAALGFEVRQRRLDLESARASIRAATDEVASAAEARRVVAERFKAGLVTSTEVLDAQQELLAAQFDRTRALAAARLAAARLDRAVGR